MPRRCAAAGDELKHLAWACQERCPPWGESYDCLPDPCPGPAATDRAAPGELDQRSVQQGALSEAVRRERQQLLDSRAPSGAGTASGASAPTSASTQDSSGRAATPGQLDKRSVQQGGQ